MFSRKAEGGAPQWRRKITLRWLASQKPQAVAMAACDIDDFASIVLARRMRRSVISALSERPVAACRRAEPRLQRAARHAEAGDQVGHVEGSAHVRLHQRAAPAHERVRHRVARGRAARRDMRAGEDDVGCAARPPPGRHHAVQQLGRAETGVRHRERDARERGRGRLADDLVVVHAEDRDVVRHRQPRRVAGVEHLPGADVVGGEERGRTRKRAQPVLQAPAVFRAAVLVRRVDAARKAAPGDLVGKHPLARNGPVDATSGCRSARRQTRSSRIPFPRAFPRRGARWPRCRRGCARSAAPRARCRSSRSSACGVGG